MDRDGLELLLMQCIEGTFRAMRADLELRIVNVLRQQDVFPQQVVLSIGKRVSQDIWDMLLSEVIKSGQLVETLRKLL